MNNINIRAIESTHTSYIDYERFFCLCTEAAQRYGNIFSLPVADQPTTYLKQVYQTQYIGGKVLDFGCGVHKPLQKILNLDDFYYHSCDSDRSGQFTYSCVEEIPNNTFYEIIAANQVFEHLSFADTIKIVLKLSQHLAPGGIFQIGTPNPQHPTRHLSNPTHITPFNYLNLCALLELSGLDPFYCVRCNKIPGPQWYERPLINLICRVFRMDWCDTVYAVGRKSNNHD